MIAKPTVFVLGAGASQPYGFPSGPKLVDEICVSGFGQAGQSTSARLRDAGIDGRLALRFAEELHLARPYSVDRFLEMRPEFLTVGKAMIANALLQKEQPALLVGAPIEVDWYRLLFDQIVRRSAAFFLTQVRHLSIITFNFDRSLERALFTALQSCFPNDDAAGLLGALRILHIHGWLGPPGWERVPGPAAAVDYGVGDKESVKAIAQAPSLIKIVHEPGTEAILADAHELLRAAELICFFGFGYHEENVAKLHVQETCGGRGALVRGTVLQKGSAEITAIRRLFVPETIHLHQGDIVSFLQNVDAIFD